MNKSVYKRPNKPAFMTVTKRTGAPERALPELPEAVTVDKFTECHVTPLDVARRMVEYLGPAGDFLTLEPQAGTGNLLQALQEAGYSRDWLVAVERHAGLCEQIRKRFKNDQYIEPVNRCFLEFAGRAIGEKKFPRIIMNPPFRKVRQHMDAALSLLGPDSCGLSVLLALVPISYLHNDAETIETLPRDTFITAQVSTKIIKFEYSYDSTVLPQS